MARRPAGVRGLVVASTFAVASYMLRVVGALVASVEPWQPLSPFTQAVETGPVGAVLPLGFAWLALAAVAVVVVAVPVFDRRDVLTR